MHGPFYAILSAENELDGEVTPIIDHNYASMLLEAFGGHVDSVEDALNGAWNVKLPFPVPANSYVDLTHGGRRILIET